MELLAKLHLVRASATNEVKVHTVITGNATKHIVGYMAVYWHLS